MYYRPLKLLWISEFFVKSGYGVAADNIVDRLYTLGRDQGLPHYDITVASLGFRTHPMDTRIPHKPYRVIPQFGNPQDLYGREMLRPIIEQVRPEAVIMLNDIWGIEHINDRGLIPNELRKTFRAVAYCPFDGEPVPPEWFPKLKQFDKVIFYSKFAYNQAIQRDASMKNWSTMIYHGVNPYFFHPMRREAVDNFKAQNNMKDKFVVGMVARNQPRKSHPRLLLAFQKFAKDKDNVMLMLHCCPQDQGWNLPDLINRFGLNGKCFCTIPHNNAAIGIPIEQQLMLYNAMDVHVLTTCYHPETNILCNPSVKTIDTVEAGEKVLTQDGSYQPVLKKFAYDYDGKMFELKFNGAPSTKVTPNHKILVLKNLAPDRYRGSYFYKKKIKALGAHGLEWVMASEVKAGDYMVLPRTKKVINKKIIKVSDYLKGIVENEKFFNLQSNQFGAIFKSGRDHGIRNTIDIDEDFCWLSGFYLAEGHASVVSGEVIFCINSREIKLRKKLECIMNTIFGLKPRKVYDTRHRLRVVFASSSLTKLFMALFDNHSKKKRIPDWMMYLPVKKQRALIRGMWEGDGCQWKHWNQKSYVQEYQTVSKIKAYQLWQMLVRLGYRASLQSSQRQSVVWKIRIFGARDKFSSQVIGDQRGSGMERHRNFMDQNYLFCRVRSVESFDYRGKIYDLHVQDNHTYCAPLVGHNSGEGFGIPTLESMACGVPNFTDDYAAGKELIEDSGGGLLIKSVTPTFRGMDSNFERPTTDIDDLAEKLQWMYDHPEERREMGRKARAYALTMTWDRMNHQWDAELQRLFDARQMAIDGVKLL